MSRHRIVTDHPHWRAFDAEEQKVARAEAKARAREAEVAEARREHEARVRAYEEEHERALIEGREPEPMRWPGEFVEPAPLLGRRKPVEVFMEKRQQLDQLRRSWAARVGGTEFAPALAGRDGELAGELRGAIASARAAVAEMEQVRDTLQWLSACGADGVPRPTGLFEVRNLLSALDDAVGRLRSGGDAPTSVPMDLDTVDIG